MILGAGFLANVPLVVPFIALALGVSAVFGTRYSILGRPWPYVRRVLHIGPPHELEVEWPPRFAQAIGFLVLAWAPTLQRGTSRSRGVGDPIATDRLGGRRVRRRRPTRWRRI